MVTANTFSFNDKKRLVMDAKLADFSEIGNILSVKSDINNGCAALFGRFGLGDLLRHLPLEKVSGVSPVMLIVSLCLFPD